MYNVCMKIINEEQEIAKQEAVEETNKVVEPTPKKKPKEVFYQYDGQYLIEVKDKRLALKEEVVERLKGQGVEVK